MTSTKVAALGKAIAATPNNVTWLLPSFKIPQRIA